MTTTRHTRSRWTLTLTVAAMLTAGLLDTFALADQNEGITPASSVTEGHIAVGGLHTCAVLADGRVQCWGSNDQGQLGNGTITTSTVPTDVPGISAAVAITAGNTHTCALISGGTVQCWGLDGNGQLGDGTAGDPAQKQQRRSPVTVSGLTGATAIAAGGFHSCAVVAGGTVKCWGDDGMGQLGDGKPGTRSLLPVAVVGLANVTALSLGEFHSCALLTDGTEKCWGHNGFGQLGDGTTINRSTPVPVVGLPNPGGVTPNPVLALTTGYGHSCALLKNNTARCWGENNFGQLGFATPQSGSVMQPSLVPKTVQHNNAPLAAPPFPQPAPDLVDQGSMIAISAGQFHTCALLSGGGARCWGNGARGQLGTDPNAFSSNPKQIEDSTYTVDVTGLPGPATALTAGGFHTCAVVGAGMQCWGYNFYGQLGSSAPASAVPVQVTAVTGAVAVSTGTGFACALVNADTARKPMCWGDNSKGQLGAGAATTASMSSIRVAVQGIASAAALDSGNGHACALTAGSLAPSCWGFNGTGQLGNATTVGSSAPVSVSGLAGAVSIDAGGAYSSAGSTELGHTCAVAGDTRVECWGSNSNGQLGVVEPGGSLADHSTPVVVQYDSDPAPPEPGNDHVTLADLTHVTTAVTGGRHSCAVVTDGTVWCWGANTSGQLGDGTTAEEHHAVHVQKDGSDPTHDNPLTGVTAVTAGATYTCARLNDGSMSCWGDNGHGQLGDGSTSTRLLPAQVSGFDGTSADRRVATITAGDDHTCALVANGAVECWGSGATGQLGTGGPGDVNVPTQVADFGPTSSSVPAQFLPVVRSLSAGRSNTCLALVDTTVYCWGDNARDQLGDGIGATSVTPRAAALAGSIS